MLACPHGHALLEVGELVPFPVVLRGAASLDPCEVLAAEVGGKILETVVCRGWPLSPLEDLLQPVHRLVHLLLLGLQRLEDRVLLGRLLLYECSELLRRCHGDGRGVGCVNTKLDLTKLRYHARTISQSLGW